jgi:hypothetical protein
MKNTPTAGLYELPLAEVRWRAQRARDLLRGVQSRVASPVAPSDRNLHGGLGAIDEALTAVDQFMPGLLEPPRTFLARAIRNLASNERAALRQALDAERVARDRLVRLLGEVPPEQADDVLVRIELEESVAAELSSLFRVVEKACHAPPLGASSITS